MTLNTTTVLLPDNPKRISFTISLANLGDTVYIMPADFDPNANGIAINQYHPFRHFNRLYWGDNITRSFKVVNNNSHAVIVTECFE